MTDFCVEVVQEFLHRDGTSKLGIDAFHEQFDAERGHFPSAIILEKELKTVECAESIIVFAEVFKDLFQVDLFLFYGLAHDFKYIFGLQKCSKEFSHDFFGLWRKFFLNGLIIIENLLTESIRLENLRKRLKTHRTAVLADSQCTVLGIGVDIVEFQTMFQRFRCDASSFAIHHHLFIDVNYTKIGLFAECDSQMIQTGQEMDLFFEYPKDFFLIRFPNHRDVTEMVLLFVSLWHAQV